MFKKFFGEKNEKDTDKFFEQPIEGELLRLEDVPDPVFSKKMLGDGFAVNPESGTVVSPLDGEVVSVFPTMHAIGLRDTTGTELLIHIGLETVGLEGQGFTSFVEDGQKVKKGQKLMEVDFESIKEKVPSIISPVVFTNLKDNEKIVLSENGATLTQN
ncbi:PTS glucose transporter subunit IIA [Planococcus sp. N028]|uniref:PTS glucose transporter subunit IIA n=1 Tax=Planococcus shixiaomingii TaxID=3058393 RepID=A0ABT8MZ96_9BACL|nr:PTS glucose transporter subunit IIA [Planococcus sp. N028]MDN7240933.1 PTS glucose transporter subunit IIA [Planococcus sp. N028]